MSTQSSHDSAARARRATRAGVLAGLAGAAILVIAILVKYPLDLAHNGAVVAGAVVGLAVLVGLGGWMLRWGLPTRDGDAGRASLWGVVAGLVFGVLWVVEISFNNVLAPPITVRDPVDNLIWAAIAVGMLIVSAASANRAGRIAAGVRTGVWSGGVSGLMACVTALLLAVFGMRFLLADAVNRAEYAVRGPTSGFPDIAAYEAYQTLAGGLLHLVVLGIVMGALLGAIGGLLGRALAAIGPARGHADA